MTAILIVCSWVLFAPVGYLACRWSNRAMDDSMWTRNDRLYAIVFSLFYGPLMPVMAVLVVLLYRLGKSEWGNHDARW